MASTVRITGGSLKGRTVALPHSTGSRYTSAKVRLAIFDLIGSVSGLTILELFAGSGAVTIEALSRGARTATVVENNRECLRTLGENMSRLSLLPQVQILSMDVRKAIPFLHERHYTYDMIFLDPPYDMGLTAEAMALLSVHRLDGPETVVVVEHSKREVLSSVEIGGFEVASEKRYGDTFVTLLEKENGTRRSF